MNRRTFVFAGTALVSGFAAGAQTKGSRLTVNVTYTGSGKVDESHKVYVVMWDSPDFMKEGASGPPIDVKGVTSKSDSLHFDDVQANPVYINMVYDPSGQWDAASPPPSGSSLGIYQKEPGTPAPVQLQPDKPTTISVSFDDSSKMP